MKVFWSWQSDHPAKISRTVIRQALEEAIDHLRETRDVTEPPDESRGEIHLDHDTKGVLGSPDVAKTILEKIANSTVFVGDVTMVGRTPDKQGNEGAKPGRPLINSNVAIEYGYALHKLGDSGIIGVMNEAFGRPEDLPFDIIHKRWPIRYRLVEEATKAEIDHQRNHLKQQFITALKGYIDNPQPSTVTFEETIPEIGKAFYFKNGQRIGYLNRLNADLYMPFRNVLYMRLIPTKPLRRPVGEKALMASAMKYGAMGSSAGQMSIVNDYGAICFSLGGATSDIDSLTQYFPNGEIWAIDAGTIRNGQRENESWYVCTEAEDLFVSTLENGLAHLKNVAGAEFPVKVTAGVVGVKGRRLVIPGCAVNLHGPMMTDEVEVTRLLHEDTLEAQDKYLLQLFQGIFEQTGALRPKGLNGFPKP